MSVQIKRAYEKPSKADGARVLVDRLWPRGVSKDDAALTAWLKAVAPSDGLRKWFHERPSLWKQFRSKYLKELDSPEASVALSELYDLVASHRTVTLIYSSRNLEHNNAVVLRDLIGGVRKPPSSSGPAKVAAGAKRARARARR